MIWTEHEDNVDNTLMFSCCLVVKDFSVPLPWQQSQGRPWPGQLTQIGQRDIPEHGTSRPVHKLGELAAGSSSRLGTGWASFSGCWAVVSWITCFSWGLFLSLLFMTISNNTINISCFVSIIKLFLPQSLRSLPFLSGPLPTGQQRWWSEFSTWCFAATWD